MFKLKFQWKEKNRNNIVGLNLKRIRENSLPRLSQRALAKKLQLAGYDLDNNVIWRIENGERYVIDLEILALSKVLDVPFEELLKIPED